MTNGIRKDAPLRKPEWLKKKIEFDQGQATSALLKKLKINTVCREARCPNISECFKKHYATFLILGRNCTRRCMFCNVEKNTPDPVDRKEPQRIAQAVKALGLRHVVITSVTRDDLSDGGASSFIETVQKIKGLATIELLIPDFLGHPAAIETVAKSKPDILGHNVETVPRLYCLRVGADYKRSLRTLAHAKKTNKNLKTKSALMLGLGEEKHEVVRVLEDLRKIGCDFLALGQYLRPSIKNTKVVCYITPEDFKNYKTIALQMGFAHVESGPYVRSSAMAERYLAPHKP